MIARYICISEGNIASLKLIRFTLIFTYPDMARRGSFIVFLLACFLLAAFQSDCTLIKVQASKSGKLLYLRLVNSTLMQIANTSADRVNMSIDVVMSHLFCCCQQSISIHDHDHYSPVQGFQPNICSPLGVTRKLHTRPHLDLIQLGINAHQENHERTDAVLQEYCRTNDVEIFENEGLIYLLAEEGDTGYTKMGNHLEFPLYSISSIS